MDHSAHITEEDIARAQEAWGSGVVAIGKTHKDGGDFRQAAADHVDRLYGYASGQVLFAPTRASEIPFRDTRKGAISYFVGGDPDFPEDQGFALRPWTSVRFEPAGFRMCGDCALSMGRYYFGADDLDSDLTVEFSFGYVRDADGRLRIVLHHSSLPFSPT